MSELPPKNEEVNPNWSLDKKQNLAGFYEENKKEWENTADSSEPKSQELATEPMAEPKVAEQTIEKTDENASIPDQAQTEVKSESKLGMDPSLYGKNYVADVSGSKIERHQPDEEKLSDNKLEELEEKKKLGEAFNVIDKRSSSWLEPSKSSDSGEESYHVMVGPDGKRTSMDNSEFAAPHKLTEEAEEQREKIYQAEKEGTGFRVKDYRSEEAKKTFSFLKPEEKLGPTESGPGMESQKDRLVRSGIAKIAFDSLYSKYPTLLEDIGLKIEDLDFRAAYSNKRTPTITMEMPNIDPQTKDRVPKLKSFISDDSVPHFSENLNEEQRKLLMDLCEEAGIVEEEPDGLVKERLEQIKSQETNRGPTPATPESRKFNLGAKIKGWYGKLDRLTKRTVLAGMIEIKQPENSTAEEEHKKSVRESVKNVETNSGTEILAELSGANVPEGSPNSAFDQNRLPSRKGLEPIVAAVASESVNPVAVPIEGPFVDPSILMCKAEKEQSLWEILGEVLKRYLKAKYGQSK